MSSRREAVSRSEPLEGSPTAFGKNATERGFRDGLPISHPAAATYAKPDLLIMSDAAN